MAMETLVSFLLMWLLKVAVNVLETNILNFSFCKAWHSAASCECLPSFVIVALASLDVVDDTLNP